MIYFKKSYTFFTVLECSSGTCLDYGECFIVINITWQTYARRSGQHEKETNIYVVLSVTQYLVISPLSQGLSSFHQVDFHPIQVQFLHDLSMFCETTPVKNVPTLNIVILESKLLAHKLLGNKNIIIFDLVRRSMIMSL